MGSSSEADSEESSSSSEWHLVEATDKASIQTALNRALQTTTGLPCLIQKQAYAAYLGQTA